MKVPLKVKYWSSVNNHGRTSLNENGEKSPISSKSSNLKPSRIMLRPVMKQNLGNNNDLA